MKCDRVNHATVNSKDVSSYEYQLKFAIVLICCSALILCDMTPSTPLDNIRVIVIVWRILSELLCARLCDNVHSQQY